MRRAKTEARFTKRPYGHVRTNSSVNRGSARCLQLVPPIDGIKRAMERAKIGPTRIKCAPGTVMPKKKAKLCLGKPDKQILNTTSSGGTLNMKQE